MSQLYEIEVRARTSFEIEGLHPADEAVEKAVDQLWKSGLFMDHYSVVLDGIGEEKPTDLPGELWEAELTVLLKIAAFNEQQAEMQARKKVSRLGVSSEVESSRCLGSEPLQQYRAAVVVVAEIEAESPEHAEAQLPTAIVSAHDTVCIDKVSVQGLVAAEECEPTAEAPAV